MNNKIVVIGCGNVGMSYAYALLNQGSRVDELVLIDKNKEKAEGEAMDLNHTLAYLPIKVDIKAGDYSDCKDATIVVIAAGVPQKEGETRLDLIKNNSVVFKEVVTSVVESGFDGIFLIATNPLDVMTFLTWKYSKFKANRIIGSGTTLDTARLQYIIGDKVSVNPKDVNAYVIGEHGDSEFVPWSSATIAQQNINKFLSDDDMEKIAVDVKNAAYEIINRKGATYYGIGCALVKITNAILDNEESIFTVSNYSPDNKIFLGTPVVIGNDGVKQRIYIELNEEETEKMHKCIDVITTAINSIEEQD
ncbi:MAG: L-lactate dehydrogenase [Bacilli bacterium]|nr:L-lactate dehydrogenase [Bacilli bacterium]